MPAHRGVEAKLYPCSGSQMPCNQMMRMNIIPPRASEDRRLAMLPAVKGRIRKRRRRNIGWSTRVSIQANTTSTARPPKSAPSTLGLVHPIRWCP